MSPITRALLVMVAAPALLSGTARVNRPDHGAAPRRASFDGLCFM